MKKNQKKKNKKNKKKRKNKCSNGHVLLEDLIIYEVLARLPVKSLFRFKSVCKKWNHIISNSPFFSTCHVKKGPNSSNFNVSCFLRDRVHHHRFSNYDIEIKCDLHIFSTDASYYQFKLSAPSFFEDALGSICGLIYGVCGSLVYIYNPITLDFTKHITYIPIEERLRRIALAYDPYNNPNFGFAIVSLVRVETDINCFTFEVYSFKTREWQASNAKARIPSNDLRDSTPVFSRGKMYWNAVRSILWFDVEQDIAGLIQCPNNKNLVLNDPDTQLPFQALGVCNGKRGELSYSMLTKEGNIEIWLLRGDLQEKFEWERRYIVRLPEIVQRNWKIMKRYFNSMEVWDRGAVAKSLACRRVVYPVQCIGGEVVWFLVKFKDEYDVVYSINMRTQELKFIHNGLPLTLHPYIPSILSVPT